MKQCIATLTLVALLTGGAGAQQPSPQPSATASPAAKKSPAPSHSPNHQAALHRCEEMLDRVHKDDLEFKRVIKQIRARLKAKGITDIDERLRRITPVLERAKQMDDISFSTYRAQMAAQVLENLHGGKGPNADDD